MCGVCQLVRTPQRRSLKQWLQLPPPHRRESHFNISHSERLSCAFKALENMQHLIFLDIQTWDLGLNEDDIAKQRFLKLLKQLRVILLQDLAVLQPGKCLILVFIDLFTNI